MLVRILLTEPDVLIDDTTNHPEGAGATWLSGYLADFTGALLVVTHERAFLDRVVTTVVELDGIHDEPQKRPSPGTSSTPTNSTSRWAPCRRGSCSLDVVEAALRAFTCTIVLVTHDRHLAGAVGCTRQLVLHDGHVDEPGEVQLGGHGDGVGGSVAVLGDDEVRLPGAG